MTEPCKGVEGVTFGFGNITDVVYTIREVGFNDIFAKFVALSEDSSIREGIFDGATSSSSGCLKTLAYSEVKQFQQTSELPLTQSVAATVLTPLSQEAGLAPGG